MNFINSSYFFMQNCIPIYVSMFTHDTSIHTHTHDFYEFVYIEKGFTTHILNNTLSVLLPGDLFGLHPGDFHGYYNVHDTVIFNCLFRKEALSDCGQLINTLPGIREILENKLPSQHIRLHLNVSQRHEMSSLLRKMQDECTVHNTGWEIKLKAHLMEFLVLVSRGYESMQKSISSVEYMNTQNILKTIKYIEENYTRKIKLEELAALTALNPDYYTKVFKKLCGLTPCDLIQHIRISRAVELLLNTGFMISDISGMVGFDDANYFARIFKKIMGVSPTTYRDKYADAQ